MKINSKTNKNTTRRSRNRGARTSVRKSDGVSAGDGVLGHASIHRTVLREKSRAPRSPKISSQPESKSDHHKAEHWDLRLYVAGQTERSVRAFDNLKKLCEQYLAGAYHIEVVDLLHNPKLARGDQIVALPTLVRKLPKPVRKIIGDLSNTEQVLVGLDLRPRRYTATLQ